MLLFLPISCACANGSLFLNCPYMIFYNLCNLFYLGSRWFFIVFICILYLWNIVLLFHIQMFLCIFNSFSRVLILELVQLWSDWEYEEIGLIQVQIQDLKQKQEVNILQREKKKKDWKHVAIPRCNKEFSH